MQSKGKNKFLQKIHYLEKSVIWKFVRERFDYYWLHLEQYIPFFEGCTGSYFGNLDNKQVSEKETNRSDFNFVPLWKMLFLYKRISFFGRRWEVIFFQIVKKILPFKRENRTSWINVLVVRWKNFLSYF